MIEILQEPIEKYLIEKNKAFKGNILAKKFRFDFTQLIEKIIPDTTRYKIFGSAGKGQWADCPWIAIIDLLITKSPQSGFYPVFLFKADMSGVFLSLNQGVTEARENYKRETKDVLKLKAEDYRAKINYKDELLNIHLNSNTTNAKLYEAGNILAKYYPAQELPSDKAFKRDILLFLNYYEQLIFNDTHFENENKLTAFENKQYRLHFRIERNSNISEKVKKAKGYICEACNFNFIDQYGDLGSKYIEAHHLKPISELEIGKTILDLEKDFSVLCSNCHSMIHKLDKTNDIEQLKRIIKKNHQGEKH